MNKITILATLLLLANVGLAQFAERANVAIDANLHPDLASPAAIANFAQAYDQDGDGRPDIALAIRQTALNQTERLLLFSSSDYSLIRSIDSPLGPGTYGFGDRLIGIPDRNGDGIGDFLVYAPYWHQDEILVVSGANGAQIGSLGDYYYSFGVFPPIQTILDLGDVMGTGGKWIAFSTPGAYGPDPNDPFNDLADFGSVAVLGIAPDGTSEGGLLLRGDFSGQRLGTSLYSVGNVDGQGGEDIVIGCSQQVIVGGDPCYYLVYDVATGQLVRGEALWAPSQRLDDVDGDGHDDYLTPNALVSGADGSTIYNHAGGSPEACGDLDGDGIEDFANWNGKVYSGATGSLMFDTPYGIIGWTGSTAENYLLLGDIGDIEGDGFDDLLYFSGGPNPIPYLTVVSNCGAKRYGENLGGLQSLDLDWVAGGQSDPAIGALEVNGAVPGALGLMAVSLAPASYDYLGLQVLVDPDPLNVVYQGGFGFGFLGEFSVAANIRSPWVAGTSFHFQAFQTWPALAASNGLELRFVP